LPFAGGREFVTIQSGGCFPFSGALINKYEHEITFGPRGEKQALNNLQGEIPFSPSLSSHSFHSPQSTENSLSLSSDAHMSKIQGKPGNKGKSGNKRV